MSPETTRRVIAECQRLDRIMAGVSALILVAAFCLVFAPAIAAACTRSPA